MKSNLKIKLSVTLLSFALISALTPHTAHAAINPGSKCSVYGQKKVSQGKIYKCIKSGKTMVWNKGSLITLPIATLTPTPTQVPAGLWQETQFKILSQFKQLKPTRIQQLNLVLSPNADKVIAKKLEDSYKEPLTYLSNLYSDSSKVTVLVMNENDREWWVKKNAEIGSLQKNDLWTIRCQVNSTMYCAYSSLNKDGSLHVGHIVGSDFIWREMNDAKTYHESIHVYQITLMGDRMEALPSWFAEGQANYLGYTFSHRFVDSRLQRKSEIVRLKAWPNVETFDDKQWFEFIQKVDSDRAFTSEGSLGYSLGELILEALYNENDFRKVHDWMVTIKNGSDYKTAFKSTFGQDYDSWLRDTAAPYLNSQI